MNRSIAGALGALAVAAAPVTAGAFVGRFVYRLANFHGAVPSSWAALAYDAAHDELFVAAEGGLSVFNGAGMEVYRIEEQESYGTVQSVAVMENGDLLLLADVGGRLAVLRCDYRGIPKARLVPSGLPSTLGHLNISAIAYRAGKVYLVDKGRMQVVVTDVAGAFQTSYDLPALMKLDAKKRADAEMSGFGVDSEGNLLFTVSTLFSGFVVSPTGQVRGFGARGSTPGKFNIAGGIARDEQGHVFVSDTLRAVVMVFDRDFQFIGEFGYRGYDRGNLVAPLDIAVGNGKVFVAQAADRGVSMFRVSFE